MTGLIELQNVAMAYGGRTVLDIPELSIPPGARLQVVGANGSGKSTLLRLICGITLPTRGRIAWTLPKRARRVAFVPQSGGYLAELSLAENARVIAATLGGWAACLADDSATLEAFDLADSVNVPMAQLSEGTRRLVVVLAAINARPNVLIADEPLAGIDDENQRRVQAHLVGTLPEDGIYLTSAHTPVELLETIHIAKARIVQ